MSAMRLIYGNEKGMVLPLGLIFLAIIAILGATAVIVTTTDLKIGSNYRASQQAFYAAEAGINVAMSNVEDFIFGDTETLSNSASMDTATYIYQATKRTSGPLRPRAGYEVGAWVGTGFDLAATGESGTAQSQIEVLSRATVPIDAYTGGK